MEKEMLLEPFWQRFLGKTGKSPSLRYGEAFHFDNSEEWAEKLLNLVLEGKKRATASSMYYFERKGLPVPKSGDFSIVTNWEGTPKCVIETTTVTVLPFREMTWELCRLEGENDCLESWIRGHTRFFSQDSTEVGYEFTPDMPVIFEEFQPVYWEN